MYQKQQFPQQLPLGQQSPIVLVPYSFPANNYPYPISYGQSLSGYPMPMYSMQPVPQANQEIDSDLPRPPSTPPPINLSHFREPLLPPQQSKRDLPPLVNKRLGNYNCFLKGIFFGVFLPVISSIMAFALETSLLTRVGVLFGTGIFFFQAFFVICSAGLWHSSEWGALSVLSGSLEYPITMGIVSVISIIFFFCATRLWGVYVVAFKEDAEEECPMVVVSPIGSRCHYVSSFLLSLVFGIVGVLLVVCCVRSLKARFGAVMGMSTSIVISGLVMFIFPRLIIFGNVFSFVGLILMHCSMVHFTRAIIVASIDS